MNGREHRALQRKLDFLRVKGARLLKLGRRDGRGFSWFITPSVALGEHEARLIIARPDVTVANRDANGVPNAWTIGARTAERDMRARALASIGALAGSGPLTKIGARMDGRRRAGAAGPAEAHRAAAPRGKATPARGRDGVPYPSILEKSATDSVATRISFRSRSRFARSTTSSTLTVTLSKKAST